MDIFSLLLQPLVLISGVGLLILSTTARFGQLEAEMKELAIGQAAGSIVLLDHLLIRARKYRLALMALYASAAVLAGASLLGGVLAVLSAPAAPAVQLLTCVAAFGVFVALVALLTESRLAIEAVEHRARSAKRPSGEGN